MRLRTVPGRRSLSVLGLAALALLVTLSSKGAAAANACVTAVDKGQDLQRAGRLREARAQYIVCSQRTCNAVVRNDCEALLEQVDEQTPSVIVRAVDARGRDVLGVRATIDDAPIELDGNPVQVDPGPRVIRARSRSGDVAEQRTLVALGEKARVVEVRFTTALEQDGTAARTTGPPADTRGETSATTGPAATGDGATTSGRRSLLLPGVLAGVGVVGLGVFTGFEIAGQSGYSDLENGCARTARRCSESEIDPVRKQFVVAGVSLGVSLAAFAAALVVYLTQRPSSSKTSARSVLAPASPLSPATSSLRSGIPF